MQANDLSNLKSARRRIAVSHGATVSESKPLRKVARSACCARWPICGGGFGGRARPVDIPHPKGGMRRLMIPPMLDLAAGGALAALKRQGGELPGSADVPAQCGANGHAAAPGRLAQGAARTFRQYCPARDPLNAAINFLIGLLSCDTVLAVARMVNAFRRVVRLAWRVMMRLQA